MEISKKSIGNIIMNNRYILSIFFLLSPFFVHSQEQVRAWEEPLEIPSYKINPPESAPIFERDWSYQRARRSVYPYVLNDNMTQDKEMKTYKAVYLENEYVKLCVLPEIGGRLFYAVDKTNGYDIFYHQHVIKPANVGMLGAWISGGVEWNVFHHHRATTYMPIDYLISEEIDGGKTIWIGETEYRHRMHWVIGITLHPGKSYIEVNGRLINSTSNDNSILYWSNVSTKVDDNYQIIFPESTDLVTFHCKNWFAHWPITHETFNNMDFYNYDIDASWWKNHFSSNSMFVYDQKEDFIAGYDHGRHAGTMITGNHNINKGGKFWLWGPNSMWDTKILTDADGHYIELMMGAYSDNQPDYSWISPYEVKHFTQYFYGIRDIGGVKAGSKDAALNLEQIGKRKYKVGINTTSKCSDMTLAISTSGKIIYCEKLDVSPSKPFIKNISLSEDINPHEMTVTLSNSYGKNIILYTPRKGSSYDMPLPKIVEKPLRPKEIENNEECYYVGLRNLQFHNPFIDPTDYFKEVLRRDPYDVRCNTKMGVWYRERGDDSLGMHYLRRAISRQTKDYTRPDDCEAMYNLGLILKNQGKIAEAIDTLYRAVWNYEYNSAANLQLAQIYLGKGDTTAALERLDEAIARNGENLNAKNLKVSILRTQRRKKEAKKYIEDILALDPLNSYSIYEKDLLDGTSEHVLIMRDEPEAYLELAWQYYHNNFVLESEKILEQIDSVKEYPSVKMMLGWLADSRGDKNAAKYHYRSAMSLPVEYCNPFRLEMIPVLALGKIYCSYSEKPFYYLGCLLYDKQPEKACSEWEKCLAINPEMDLALRNLGWYNWLSSKDYEKSADYYSKAVALAPEKALYLEEQDQVLEACKADVDKRYKILKNNHATALKRYYPLAQEVVLGTYLGDYDYVIGLLHDCYFPTREGVANFHDIYVDAMLMAGYRKFKDGDYSGAITVYKKAFDYPVNHQVFLVDERTPRDAQIYSFCAEAYEKLGQSSKAREQWNKAVRVNVGSSDYSYWKGLALRRLGNKQEADSLFFKLKESGRNAIVDHVVNFYGAEGTTGVTPDQVNSKAYYTMGLGCLGLGEKEEAHKYFEKSKDLKYDTIWAKFMLDQ
ncbi:MAG: DUF5107 domain-containing protein [Bacteroidales bacterium]|nr:DUF5107 domain-containing protein [Bacteroidales bacterium]